MGRSIPDEVIDQIRLRADIVEVVQSYVPQLKKNGRSYMACCPFHQEKTPSFHVNPDRQSYHCFGCGKGGNAITFVMEMERLDFPNAIELLARKYNIIIPEATAPYRGGYRREQGQQADYNLRERLYLIHEKLASWYVQNLRENPASPVAQYLATRHLPQDFILQFQLGAAPDAWDGALNWARREGFTEQEIRESGIFIEKEGRPGHFYDRFRNRLMFPIWNEQGRVVAFSSRAIEKDTKMGKYVNSPESPIFKKGRTLYALHFARMMINDTDSAILCEGQIDTIALHRAGCKNAVAPQGTAFGAEQAAILKRYTRNIFLAVDNDEAGRKAVFKDASILLPLGFNLKVVKYPDAKDADEVVSKQGEQALADAVHQAADFFEFSFQYFGAKYDLNTPVGKAGLVSEMLDQVLLLDSPVTRDVYLSWLSEKLQVEKSSIDTEFTRRIQKKSQTESYQVQREVRRERAREELNQAAAPSTPAAAKPLPRSEANPRLKHAFRDLFRLIMKEKQYAEAAEGEITAEMLDESPLAMSIEIVMQSKYTDDWEDSSSKVMTELLKKGLEIPTEISAALADPDETPEVPVQTTAEPAADASDPAVPVQPPPPDPEQEKRRRAAAKKEQILFRDTLDTILEIYYTTELDSMTEQMRQFGTDLNAAKALMERYREISLKRLTLKQKGNKI